ncbi:MAG: FtsX-like permease family protein [Pedobacter sp.]|nr:MAG: FtsX-like permease family protein [Pedobacter sp.]
MEMVTNETCSKFDVMEHDLLQSGLITSTARSSSSVTGINSNSNSFSWPGKDPNLTENFGVIGVSIDYGHTVGWQFVDGRDFSKDFLTDSIGLVINEAAVNYMGLKKPVGKLISVEGKNYPIIGVVKDFHVTSLHEKIRPMVFSCNPQNTNSIVAKLENGKEKETLKQLDALYKKFNPGYVLDYTFLDDTYQKQYVSEQRVSLLSQYFAGLAILISCLGLFGLAAFNAEVRTKEIGIRKVLGASVENVVLLLSKDFLRLILLAALIAFPLAWWALNVWLNGFAYHITISPWLFVVAGVAVLLVALLTLSYQSIKTAFMNPIKSLRTE